MEKEKMKIPGWLDGKGRVQLLRLDFLDCLSCGMKLLVETYRMELKMGWESEIRIETGLQAGCYNASGTCVVY